MSRLVRVLGKGNSPRSRFIGVFSRVANEVAKLGKEARAQLFACIRVLEKQWLAIFKKQGNDR